MSTGLGIGEKLSTYGPPLLLVVLLLLLIGGLLSIAGPRNPMAARLYSFLRRQRLATGIIVLLLLLLTVLYVERVQANERDERIVREQALAAADSNLVPNPRLQWSAEQANPPTWEVVGSTRVSSGCVQQTCSWISGGEVRSSLIWVQPGHSYSYSVAATTSGVGQIVLEWHGANPGDAALSWADFPLQGNDAFVQGTVTAPPVARFLRVIVRSGGGEMGVQFVRVVDAGVRVEQWPDGARAALAYSFDWESTMGGPVHSKGYAEHNVSDATRRGLAMRAGADLLLDLFAQYGIRGTFYSTGYNLLDGNSERRIFLSNPTYKWANTDNRWSSNYWKTHPWYGDDPFGTYESDPAWYFGDQSRRMIAAGQEIASHTFGHLYVRGLDPNELGADAAEWTNAAAAIGVSPAQSFAFPWQSSNSVTADFYRVLEAAGINSVTRLFTTDLTSKQDMWQITALSVYTPLAVMPDYHLGQAASEESADSLNIGLARAEAIVDELIVRRGATSFWNHPEDISVQQETQEAWREIVAYGAQKQQEGLLYIAPVSEIIQYARDMDNVVVQTTRDGDTLHISVTNNAGHNLAGVTLTLPNAATSAIVAGQTLTLAGPETIVLPALAAGSKIEVNVEMVNSD